MSGFQVGIVGATGAVGEELMALLQQRGFPVAGLHLFASSRSVGRRLRFGDQELEVSAVDEGALSKLDFVFLSAGGALSLELAPRIASSRTTVIDNSSAFRSDPSVPLVVPEVNGEVLRAGQPLIANPNCSTIVNVMAVAPLHREFFVERMIVATYQATSGAGARGLSELLLGTEGFLAGDEPAHDVFPRPIAFNVIPAVGEVTEGESTAEELKMLHESRKILGHPTLDAVTTCVRVPTARAHAVATTLFCREVVERERALSVLGAAKGIVLDSLPTPRATAGQDAVAVGRLRVHPADPRVVSLFAVGDQIRKGAALNALQIAESIMHLRGR